MNKTTILIVEDEAIVAADLASKLGQLGYVVAGTAARGDDAVRLARELRPDLILMDIRLPGPLDGVQAAEAIRRDGNIPVIYLTAHSDPATLERAKHTEPFGYILKPFEERDLQTHIEIAVYKHQAERRLRESRATFEDALSSMTDAVFISDAEGRFVEFNDAFATFHRFKNKTDCAKTLAEYPDILDVFMADGTLAPLDMWAVPRALRGETLSNVEYALRRKDTGETWVGSYSFGPIRDASGAIVGSVVVGRDITDQKRSEEQLRSSSVQLQTAIDALRNSRRAALNLMDDALATRREAERASAELQQREEQLRIFVEHAPAAIAMFDANMRYVAASRQWLADYGLGGQDVLGQSHYAIFPEIPERWKQIHRRCLAGAVERAEEDPFDRADGSRQWLRWEIHPWKSAPGTVGGIVIFTEDITERKRVQDRVARLTRLYAVLSRVSEAIVRIDDELVLYGEVCRVVAEEGNFPLVWIGEAVDRRVVSRAAFGPAVDYLKDIQVEVDGPLGGGPTGTAIREGHPVVNQNFGLNPPMSPWREAALRHGFQASAAFPLRREDKAIGALTLYSATPDAFDAEQVRLLGALSDDLSYALDALQQERMRVEAEQELRRTARELARSNKELEQFAYVASHDLQEPLRMVTSFAGLLRSRYRGKLDAKADEYIDFATEGASRMQELIADLLTYSRVSGKPKELKPTDVEQVLEAALVNLKVAIQASEASITHDALPTVVADGGQLTQLFQNLIGNAIKYVGAGVRPEIHVGARRAGAEECEAMGGSAAGPGKGRVESRAGAPAAGATPRADAGTPSFWLFSVRDNGIGIDPRFAERIFEIFQRLHTREQYEGTGIGLSICRKIVERHGGRIWVESELEKGSTFCFTIPA